MTIHGVEAVLYDLGVKRVARTAFADDADEFLSHYRVDAGEAKMLKEFDVRGLQKSGASPLLTMGFWMMNEPSRSRAAYLDRLRDGEQQKDA